MLGRNSVLSFLLGKKVTKCGGNHTVGSRTGSNEMGHRYILCFAEVRVRANRKQIITHTNYSSMI